MPTIARNHLLLVAIDKQRVVTFKAVSAADGGDSDFSGGSTDKSRLNDAEYRRGLNDSSAAMSTGREQWIKCLVFTSSGGARHGLGGLAPTFYKADGPQKN